jgi:hypothetical protein
VGQCVVPVGSTRLRGAPFGYCDCQTISRTILGQRDGVGGGIFLHNRSLEKFQMANSRIHTKFAPAKMSVVLDLSQPKGNVTCGNIHSEGKRIFSSITGTSRARFEYSMEFCPYDNHLALLQYMRNTTNMIEFLRDIDDIYHYTRRFLK